MSGLNESKPLKYDAPLKEHKRPEVGKLYMVSPLLKEQTHPLESSKGSGFVYLTKGTIYMLIGIKPIARKNNAGTWWAWESTFLDGEKLIEGTIPCWVWHHWLWKVGHE